jgi:RNase H-fold protein (predicted Holliday junction resolvase)
MADECAELAVLAHVSEDTSEQDDELVATRKAVVIVELFEVIEIAVQARPATVAAQAERELLARGMTRRRRRAVVDQVAAALILQSFLERRGGRDS